jgi:membrane protein implicated in regulation of membrane protease activity
MLKSPFGKYVLLQVPGWLIAALLLLSMQQWFAFSSWVAYAGVAAWMLKDFALYPLVRTAYDFDVKTGVEQLIGAQGMVQNELAPRGKIRVRGELWSAEIEPGAQPLAQGEQVRVLGAQGLTLIVAAESTSSRENHSHRAHD